MLDNRWADAADLDQMNAEIAREIDQAVEWAENSPYPDPSELTDGVYET